MTKIDTQIRKTKQDIRPLRTDEVEAVSGGGLGSMVSEVMKNFGSALNTAARGG